MIVTNLKKNIIKVMKHTATDGELLTVLANTFPQIFIQDAKECLNVTLTHQQLLQIIYGQWH